jgi:hypothetical protein
MYTAYVPYMYAMECMHLLANLHMLAHMYLPFEFYMAMLGIRTGILHATD